MGKDCEAEKRQYFRDEWRAWRISDHLRMWVALDVDFTEEYLESLKPRAAPLAD